MTRIDYGRQPGGLGVLRGVAEGVAEEVRTRGFAPLGFPRFAFVVAEIMRCQDFASILGCT